MQRILCATDLSEAADEALRQADEIARATGATLALCHVIPDSLGVHPLFPQRHLAEAVDAPSLERQVGEALTDRARTVIGRGPDEVKIVVETGAVYPEIVRHAELWPADLVVTASRGLSGVARVVLGSVAGQVVRYCHCPVLVARPMTQRGVVIAATDLSDAALPAVEAGVREAARRKATLVVMHALETPSPALAALGSPFGLTYPTPSAETMTEVRSSARTALESALERFGAKGEVVVVDGDPAESILKEAEARHAELVVVATRGRTGLSRVALGSVAERVIQHATSSVLAVRLGA